MLLWCRSMNIPSYMWVIPNNAVGIVGRSPAPGIWGRNPLICLTPCCCLCRATNSCTSCRWPNFCSCDRYGPMVVFRKWGVAWCTPQPGDPGDPGDPGVILTRPAVAWIKPWMDKASNPKEPKGGAPIILWLWKVGHGGTWNWVEPTSIQ